ncbi:MAG: glutathione S-transferase family protein [Kiloniellales bacterium]|nr:glutathione S-transferase family protein [Kiloniellales bacterium]
MYVLYGGPFTRALMVEMVMAEGEIAYELRTVNILEDAHHAPAYLAINPAGWVPALVTPEGETLTETPAINLYLAERHRLSHLAPRIDEPERGRFLSGLFFLTNDLEPWLKRAFYPRRFALREDDAAAVEQHAIAGVLDRFQVIDRRLDDRGPYHLGERFSLVDLTMAYWAVCLEPSGGLAPYAAVRRCMALVMDRPKLRAKFDELEAGRDDYARRSARGAGIR